MSVWSLEVFHRHRGTFPGVASSSLARTHSEIANGLRNHVEFFKINFEYKMLCLFNIPGKMRCFRQEIWCLASLPGLLLSGQKLKSDLQNSCKIFLHSGLLQHKKRRYGILTKPDDDKNFCKLWPSVPLWIAGFCFLHMPLEDCSHESAQNERSPQVPIL